VLKSIVSVNKPPRVRYPKRHIVTACSKVNTRSYPNKCKVEPHAFHHDVRNHVSERERLARLSARIVPSARSRTRIPPNRSLDGLATGVR
jgi:hypothetical protein